MYVLIVAAILGGIAEGRINERDIMSKVPVRERIHPNPEWVPHYERLKAQFARRRKLEWKESVL